MEKRKMNVVFIGGSITEGGAASCTENRWVNLVGEYLKGLYTDREVKIINAGIGGTGSYFGVFRLKKDVIAHEPDMVFIEFAVNDMGAKSSPWVSAVCMEGIVRQLMRLKKIPVIIFVFTASYHAEAVSSVHKKIAYYYNIPFVDIQDNVWKQIGRGDYKWEDIEVDEVHPNDRGHRLFADMIIEAIGSDMYKFLAQPVPKEKTITGYDFINPAMVSFQQAEFFGNWNERTYRKPRLGTVITSCTPHDSLEFEFTGKCIGLYHVVSPDSGILNVTIDGIDMGQVDLYKKGDTDYCLMSKFDLENKPHKMVIEISDRKNQESTGHSASIGWFLVDM